MRLVKRYKPVILVTGCSSGLGLAIAELLYRQTQYRVVVTARPESWHFLQTRFSEDSRFWILPMDVTLDMDRTKTVSLIEQHWGGVDILINNAGVSYRSVVEHMTEADEEKQMNTNYRGPMGLIRQVLPHMRKIGRGKIINVSSVSGMIAMPTMASYSASKYALEGASEALWYEMKPLGINVSLIQPGFIRSKSFEKVYISEGAKAAEANQEPYHDYYQNMTPFIQKLMGLSQTSPEEIAMKVLKVIQTENPPLWIAATLDAVVFYYLRRWIPRRFLLPILFWALPKSKSWARGYSMKRLARPFWRLWRKKSTPSSIPASAPLSPAFVQETEWSEEEIPKAS